VTPPPPGTDPFVERDRLRHQAYADDKPLAARASIYQYAAEPIDLHDRVLALLGEFAGGDVLDVGCGPGAYLARLGATGGRRVGLDLSEGMVAIARSVAPAASVLCGDAQELPFPSATFDAVMAPHMLYHLPDMGRGAAEMARALRPGGVAVVVTNGQAHQQEVADLVAGAADDLAPGTGRSRWVRFMERFTLEDGAAVLAPSLEVDHVEHYQGRLAVPEPAPVVAYVDSTRSLWEPRLPAGVTWPALMAAVERRVDRAIAADGTWRATVHAGAFRCRRKT